MISNIFNAYVYEPIFEVLVFIYENLSFHDLGGAIIILTVLVRIVLFPIFYKSAKDQTLMRKIQPKMKELQEKFKNDKEAQAKALMSLYKEHKLNPFSGFLLLLVQLPIFFALFKMFSNGLSKDLFDSTAFFGFIDVSERSIALAVLAAGLQYLQGKITFAAQGSGEKNHRSDPAASMGKMMIVLGPAMTLIILFSLPSALGIYWTTSTVFSIGQQFYINKKINGAQNEKNKETGDMK